MVLVRVLKKPAQPVFFVSDVSSPASHFSAGLPYLSVEP